MGAGEGDGGEQTCRPPGWITFIIEIVGRAALFSFRLIDLKHSLPV